MTVPACLDCGRNTVALDEYYMLWDDVWPGGDGMLCIECVARRIGRRLSIADFSDAPINFRHDLWAALARHGL